MIPKIWVPALAVLSGCSAGDLGGECATDDDCPAGGLCVFEASRGTTFCSRDCENDLDCDATQFCGGLVEEPRPSDSSPERSLCRPLVQSCADEEVCNGLDDDCDGRIDESCVVQTCQFEARCGPFSCTPTEGAERPSCQPRQTEGRDFFGPCESGSDCPNGICNAGFCSPLCAPTSLEPEAGCPSARSFEIAPGETEILPLVCANQVLEGEPARHDACQVPCINDGECPFETRCVWRTEGVSGLEHESVCATPPSDRRPLGAACPDNSVEGDASCAFGLCFFQTCTRFCEGSGDDCSDVGEDFVCEPRTLTYSEGLNSLDFIVPGVCVPRS